MIPYGTEEYWESSTRVVGSKSLGYTIPVSSGHPFDGYYILYALTIDENANEKNMLKIDSFSGYLNDFIHSINNDLIILGSTGKPDKKFELYMSQIDSYTKKKVKNSYDDIHSIWGSRIKKTKDGGYIIVGETRNGFKDILLIKTDENGNEKWRTSLGGEGYESGYDVIELENHGYLLLGKVDNRNGDYDIYLIKTDRNGNIYR